MFRCVVTSQKIVLFVLKLISSSYLWVSKLFFPAGYYSRLLGYYNISPFLKVRGTYFTFSYLCKINHFQILYVVFLLVSWRGVRLSPLGMSATTWPLAPNPDDRRLVWSSRWNDNRQGKPKYSEKTCLSATLSTTNPIWRYLGSNPDRLVGNTATNRLN
jgi:hypothetical protein